jgi:hypothetical protein
VTVLPFYVKGGKHRVQNYIETCVKNTLLAEISGNVSAYAGICYCGHCISFICSSALNKLLPCYYATNNNVEYYYDDTRKVNKEVLAAVKEALQTLKQTPQHQ